MEGQFDRPVMRQIDGAPVAVIESNRAGGHEVPRLLEVPDPLGSIAEILRRIVRIPEVKAPAEIQQQALPSRTGQGSFRRRLSGRKRLMRLSAGLHREPHRTHSIGHRHRSRRQQPRLQQIATRYITHLALLPANVYIGTTKY